MVAISLSRGSFSPRNQTQVSCIAGRLYQLSYEGIPHAMWCGQKINFKMFKKNSLKINLSKLEDTDLRHFSGSVSHTRIRTGHTCDGREGERTSLESFQFKHHHPSLE